MPDPDRWPFLPLRKNQGDYPKNCGILVIGQGPTVFQVNVFDIPEDLDKAERITYDSFEAVITGD